MMIQTLIQKLMRPVQDVEGATAVEYGVMVALIAAVIIAAVQLIGTNLNLVFNGVAGVLTFVAP